MEWVDLWTGLGWPLMRLMFFISLGLFIGNLIEALNWTNAVARIAAPLVRIGRLKDIAGASFSLAFFSGVAANTMLAESHAKGEISDKELVFANLFNSLPTYFLHLPTIFFITLPFIGKAAFVYVGLTLGSAFLRTGAILVMGRMLLPPLEEGCVPCRLQEHRATGFRDALKKTWARFKKRIRKVALFTVPIYTLLFFLVRAGLFDYLEQALAGVVGNVSILPPEAMGIVVFHVAAEFTAGLAAAGALMQAGDLALKEIVLALLVGNVLSSPMRAFRHQFPYYAGIFNPRTALRLIVYNQSLRAASIVVVTVAYALFG